ncbi:hypothetical protein C8R43DRAFT_1121551 [Mycena crocata]|nr:hypothetical protein C8R43DRAFT_1121551 [Mycena crocata]
MWEDSKQPAIAVVVATLALLHLRHPTTIKVMDVDTNENPTQTPGQYDVPRDTSLSDDELDQNAVQNGYAGSNSSDSDEDDDENAGSVGVAPD